MITAKVEIDPNFGVPFREVGEFLAYEYYKRLVANIKSNKYGYTNKPATIKRKGKNTPMIDTGEYLNGIYVDENKVRVLNGTHSSGLTFDELAALLEFGRRDKGFKGYPVWRRTLDEFKQQIPTLLKNYKKKL